MLSQIELFLNYKFASSAQFGGFYVACIWLVDSRIMDATN